MPVPNIARRGCVAANARSRAQYIERLLKRFPAHNEKVRALAARHPALGDLSFTFPGLLFALATARDAQAATQAVMEGRPLREIAALIGLPMWLRALPPEAFVFRLEALPDGPLFARRIGNHMPRSPKHAGAWLHHVGLAARWGDDNLAVWVAQEMSRAFDKYEGARTKLVCLWAWHSARPETRAGALCARRWSPRMTFARAVEEARDWLANIEVVCTMGQGVADGWLTPGEHDGYAFEPLLTAQEVFEQARLMRNCVRSFASSLVEGRCRLWTVRRDGASLATVEVGPPWFGRVVTVKQAQGPGNRNPPPELERALHAWLRAQPLAEGPAPSDDDATLHVAEWRSFWRDYWRAKRGAIEWLPLPPDADALRRLRWGKRAP